MRCSPTLVAAVSRRGRCDRKRAVPRFLGVEAVRANTFPPSRQTGSTSGMRPLHASTTVLAKCLV